MAVIIPLVTPATFVLLLSHDTSEILYSVTLTSVFTVAPTSLKEKPSAPFMLIVPLSFFVVSVTWKIIVVFALPAVLLTLALTV